MARAKGMTYEELLDYAKQHYNKGGDGIYECWDERINELLEEQIGLSNQLTEARSKLQDAEEARRAANLEILKLKAKLYDYMVAKEEER